MYLPFFQSRKYSKRFAVFGGDVSRLPGLFVEVDILEQPTTSGKADNCCLT